MGRRRKSNHFLPRLVYKKGRCFWFAGTNPWTNLGSDVGVMYEQYARLMKLDERAQHAATTFADVVAQYAVRSLSNLAPRTQKDYREYLYGTKKLMHVFGHMRLEDITPAHVTKYHALRGEKSQVQANREKACMSAVWNWGRRVGLTSLPNPCLGVRRHTETGRDVYVDHGRYHQVWAVADWDVRDVMDLVWLTGQRPADVFKMTWEKNVVGDDVVIRQGKTNAPVRVAIGPELGIVLNDIAFRRGCRGRLVSISEAAFDNRFEHDRRKAGVDLDLFQLRDLRAKAGTEMTDKAGIREAQALLGHTTQKTTETYVRKRLGKRVRSVE